MGDIQPFIPERVLWVCRENVGRSQVAREFWNKHSQYSESYSAGFSVDESYATVGEHPSSRTLIEVMRAIHGIDIERNTRTDIREINTDEFSRVFVLCESEAIPDKYLTLSNATYLEVPDMKDTGYEETVAITNLIKSTVGLLATKAVTETPG